MLLQLKVSCKVLHYHCYRLLTGAMPASTTPTGQAVGNIDGSGNDEAGDDGGLVAQGQTKDDVSGRAGTAGIGHILHNTSTSQQ